jgi:hypothetical protein
MKIIIIVFFLIFIFKNEILINFWNSTNECIGNKTDLITNIHDCNKFPFPDLVNSYFKIDCINNEAKIYFCNNNCQNCEFIIKRIDDCFEVFSFLGSFKINKCF